MDKNSAINLINKTFNKAFDEVKFTNFIQNLLNDFEIKPYKASGNTIWEDQRDHVSYYKRIGKYIDPEGEALDVLIVQVKNLSKLERARTALRNFVIKHLNNFEKDYALVAFYSKEDKGLDWRFSFVKREIQSYLDEKTQKVKMRKEFTPAKRYSFLVGEYEKSHTAQTQLLPLLQNIANNPTISELEKAFSIERVTDEFFEQYKNLYIKVFEYFDKQDLTIFENGQLDASGFTKKLLGQIVFLYFLQKKGWLGVPKNKKWGAGKRHFLQQLYDESLEKNQNFFKDYLQYLFYEALAKERDNDNSFYPRFNCRIPFLNGGLFEAQYDWQNANISIPQDFFRSSEEKEEKRTGILDVFDRYNFTIKEDEPLDKEVAVDPEMLGKVFENMLEIKERKSKGAFYTPREIVHYMCQESLIHYLDNSLNNYSNAFQELGTDQTNMFGNEGNKGQQSIQSEINVVKVPKEDIEQYIREGHLALENDVRVAARGETKTYQFQLPESVRNHADVIDKRLTEIRICDPAIGSGAFPVGLLHELVTAQLVLKPHLSYTYLNNKLIDFGFQERESVNESRYVYRLKKHIIQESIYGVDIDRSAIDIARLRLWLSLVVDEDDLEPIETLPNLDYKIVCGNSLIGMPDGTMRDLKIEKELEALKEEFYHLTNGQRKKDLRNKINNKIRELLDTAETFAGYKIDFDFKLYFSEVWHEKNGFDVVIGNPPYVDIKQLNKTLVRFLFENFETTENRINLYSTFIEKGLSLINQIGGLTYINPNSMLLNSSYKKLRKLTLDRLLKVIKLPDGVFKEASVETIIIQYGRRSNYDFILGAFYKKDDLIDFKNLDFSSYDSNIWQNDKDCRISIFTSPEQLRIIDKLNNSEPLSTNFEFCLGITPYDKYKGHSPEDIKNKVFHSDIKKTSEYKPLISGKNINRFFVDSKDLKGYIKYGNWLGAPRKEKFFTNPRVVVRQIVSGHPPKIYAGFTKEPLYHTQIGFAILGDDKTEEELKYLCGLLESDIINFYHFYKYLDIEKVTFQKILIENCKSFPYPQTTIQNIQIISVIIDYLILISQYITNLSNENLYTYFEEVNSSVFFEIFFENKFQSTKKEILKHLSDLKPINEAMSDEEKLGIIQSEYERLYHPDHPVRFAIETLDSIEEVRIIREALK